MQVPDSDSKAKNASRMRALRQLEQSQGFLIQALKDLNGVYPYGAPIYKDLRELRDRISFNISVVRDPL